jgi:ketosteroid isomerase-like protein
MSQEDVKLHRRFVEAFNARDVEGLVSYCDPQIELHSTFAEVGGAVYHGHEGIRKWHRDLEEAWGSEISAESEITYFVLGEYLLGFYELGATGRRSGAEVTLPTAAVARWRDGRLNYFKSYAHREDALRELGVSEDELEPVTS